VARLLVSTAQAVLAGGKLFPPAVPAAGGRDVQAGRDAAARPAAARAATLVADVCGSPHDAAFFMRTLRRPASASANSVLPFAAARQSERRDLTKLVMSDVL